VSSEGAIRLADRARACIVQCHPALTLMISSVFIDRPRPAIVIAITITLGGLRAGLPVRPAQLLYANLVCRTLHQTPPGSLWPGGHMQRRDGSINQRASFLLVPQRMQDLLAGPPCHCHKRRGPALWRRPAQGR